MGVISSKFLIHLQHVISGLAHILHPTKIKGLSEKRTEIIINLNNILFELKEDNDMLNSKDKN